jgi:uncharacterized phage infection (PIP) family protein YhgE
MAIGSEARSTFLAIVKGDASQAVSEFKKLGNSVEKSTKQANGSVGQFKQFTSSAFDEIKANAGAMAAGAGVAIAGFAVHAAMQFSELGVAVGKFSDATGLSLDAASRWTEVTGDLGIETGTLQTALNKMNRELDPAKFREMGVAIAYTKDGATDVNATFLNVIDRLNEIKDPAERAKVATKLLGRNWQQLSELIGKGSNSLRKALSDVSDAKIISPEERKRAEELRDAMADLRDVYEDFVLKVGALAAPVLGGLAHRLTSVAQFATNAARAFDDLSDSIPGAGLLTDALDWPNELAGAIGDGVDILMDGEGEFDAFGLKFTVTTKKMTEESNKAGGSLAFLGDLLSAAAAAADEQAQATKRTYDSTRKLRQAIIDLNDIQIESQAGRLDALTAYYDFIAAQKEYNKVVAEGKTPTEELAKQSADLATQAADLDKAQQEAAGGTQTAAERTAILISAFNEMQKTLKVGSPLWNAIQAYKNALLTIPSNVNTKITVNGKVVQDNTSGKQGAGAGFGIVGTAAAGTDRARRGTYLVGENGPELVSMRGGERVYPTPDTMAMLGAAKLGQSSGNTTNVYVTVNGGDPNAVVRKIKEYQRRGGVI